MSEVGSPAVGSPVTGNDAARGADMPSVPANVERMRPSDFMKARREGTLSPGARREAPKSTREHIADVSRVLEQRGNERSGQHVTDKSQAGTQFDKPQGSETALDQAKQTEQPAEAQPETAEAAPAAEEEGQEALSALSDQEILAKYREWEQSDLFPDEMLGKMHEVKVRGQTRYVDTNELRQGYMRHSDYTQRGNELRAKEQRFSEQESFYKQHFEAIRDPGQMLEIYERNGYGDQLEKVAEMIAERRVEHRSLVRAAGHAAALKAGFTNEQIALGQADNHRVVVEAMQRADARLKATRQTEIQNRKLQAENERTRAQQQQAQHAQEVSKHQETYARQLAQLMPGALKSIGLQPSPQNDAALKRCIGEVIALEGGIGNDGITRRHVMAAAKNLAEEREDRQLAERGGVFLSAQEARAAQQAASRQALPPTRTGTGGGRPLGNTQTQAMRASDFEKARRAGTLGKR